mmetsp:Transcript_12035/g.28699  ORF Transcript_12035/g.28699 Transcript_12035/m.28699 type:complete len:206 (-) Transcript_12035:690-1307(-)
MTCESPCDSGAACAALFIASSTTASLATPLAPLPRFAVLTGSLLFGLLVARLLLRGSPRTTPMPCACASLCSSTGSPSSASSSPSSSSDSSSSSSSSSPVAASSSLLATFRITKRPALLSRSSSRFSSSSESPACAEGSPGPSTLLATMEAVALPIPEVSNLSRFFMPYSSPFRFLSPCTPSKYRGSSRWCSASPSCPCLYSCRW